MQENVKKVLKMAELSRLDLAAGLAPEEAEKKLEQFARQFGDVVALMDTLAEVDTEGIEPLYWPLSAPAASVREDVAAKRNSREELLKNSPEQDGQFFVVPRIV